MLDVDELEELRRAARDLAAEAAVVRQRLADRARAPERAGGCGEEAEGLCDIDAVFSGGGETLSISFSAGVGLNSRKIEIRSSRGLCSARVEESSRQNASSIDFTRWRASSKSCMKYSGSGSSSLCARQLYDTYASRTLTQRPLMAR